MCGFFLEGPLVSGPQASACLIGLSSEWFLL